MTYLEFQEINNLLAIIHRDGGHHTGKVGLLQSILDAKKIITNEPQMEDKKSFDKRTSREEDPTLRWLDYPFAK